MSERPRVDRELLRSVFRLAGKSCFDTLLWALDREPPHEAISRTVRRKLIYALTSDALAAARRAEDTLAVVIPDYAYSRSERVKVALLAAQAAAYIDDDASVLCVTGASSVGAPDTVLCVRTGQPLESGVDMERVALPGPTSTPLLDTMVALALQIGHEGYEGHPVGTILVVGDSTAVMEKSKQLTLNPFQGYAEAERNVLDPEVREAVRTFATLDGAIVVREDGVVLAASRYLYPTAQLDRLPFGLGARHAAAAAISMETEATAIAVSQTSGAMRVFQRGELVLEIKQPSRRAEPGLGLEHRPAVVAQRRSTVPEPRSSE